MPFVKTLLSFSVIIFATGKFLIFVHLVIVHQVRRKAPDFPGSFTEQRKPVVGCDWNSDTASLQLPLSFMPVPEVIPPCLDKEKVGASYSRAQNERDRVLSVP